MVSSWGVYVYVYVRTCCHGDAATVLIAFSAKCCSAATVMPQLCLSLFLPNVAAVIAASSQGAEGAAADAQAAGLMHLGSFYVNPSMSSTTNPMIQLVNSHSHSTDDSVGSGGGGGEGSTPCSKCGAVGIGVPGACCGGGNNGQQQQQNGVVQCSSYRPAPRTPYMASRLYTMNGSVVSAVLCEGACALVLSAWC